MLFRHIVTLFLIILFSFILWNKKSFRNTDTKYFWLTIACCLLLVFQDSLETLASYDSSLRFIRTLLSILGYTLRSVAPLGLLLVIISPKKRNLLLWIPSLITFLTCCTAFFSGIAFGFDENYAFYRGPLGYVAFVVPVLYLLLILIITFKHFSSKKGLEKYVPSICAIFCLSTTIIGVFYGGDLLTEAIMISGIFFYMILYSHDNRCDILTGLLNRQAFYDDCSTFNKYIKAVASLDMNGLKTLNDNYGHQAGDDALKKIGECINEITDYNTSAYRVGGDEFIILFFYDNDELLSNLTKQIKENVKTSGYSISVGYALRHNTENLYDVVKESDHQMYKDKERYYKEKGIDRKINYGIDLTDKKS